MADSLSHSLSLREIRNVPETINATFEFLRAHHRKLGRLLLFRVYPVLFFANALDLIHLASQSGGGNILITIVRIIALIIAFSIMTAVVHALAKLADRTPSGNFNESDVWQEAKDLLGVVVGTNVGLAFSVAFLFIVFLSLLRVVLFGIPFLFVLAMFVVVFGFGVRWSLYYPSRLLDNGGFTESFGTSNYLVRGRWWQTFGLLIIWVLLGYALSAVVVLPSMLAGIGSDLVPQISIKGLQGSLLGIIILHLLTFVSYALYITVQSLPMVGMVLHFYSQQERREGTRLLNLAATIGTGAGGSVAPVAAAQDSWSWETERSRVRGDSDRWDGGNDSVEPEDDVPKQQSEPDSNGLEND